MSNFDNSNRFSIWPNKDRKTAAHPHLTGQGESGTTPHWVSGWFADDLSDEDKAALGDILKRRLASGNNKPIMKFSIKAKDGQTAQTGQAAQTGRTGQAEPAQESNDFDMDIPF
jgi:hypothetical protein